jgi:hypothetical protein
MSDLVIPIVGLLASLAALLICLLVYCDAVPPDKNPFAKIVPERWRWAHRWFAHLTYYAWQPCPLCGQKFGGHEWRDIDGKPSIIPNPASRWWGSLGICPACTRAGLGRDDHTLKHRLKGD